MGGGSVARARIEVDADVSRAEKEINRLRGELGKLERAKFLPGSTAAAAATKEIDKLNKGIHELGGTVDKSSNFINRHSTAINQLAFSAARAGSGFANFLPLIARSTTLLARHEFGAGGFGKALGSLKDKLRGSGEEAKFTQLSLDGMGAAGGKAAGAMARLGGVISGTAIAAAAAVTAFAALVIGIGFLTAKLGPLGSELNRAQESIKNIFGAAGDHVQDFAERASIAFGITEQAALVFLGKTGSLFQSFGINAARSAELSESLLVMTDVLRTTAPAFIDAETAMQAMFSVAAGNIEGLREFNIFLTEVSIKETLRAHKINVTTQTLDNQQRSLAALLAVNDEAVRKFDEYINTQDSAARVSERTAAAIKDIKAKLGEGLAPLLALVANAFLGFLIGLRGIAEGAQDFFDKHPLIVKALKAIGEVAMQMAPGLDLLVTVLGFFGDKGKEAAEKALGLEERMEKLVSGGKALEDQLRTTFEPTIEQLEQLIDAHKRLADATADAGRAIKDAELDLSRAREDAVRDREDAQRNLAEVIEDAVEKEFEARKKVDDVKKKNFRAIRDAERDLKKERLESARRVDDAERALAEARKKRADAILQALIAVQDAQFKFDTQSFNRAQRELTKARQSTDVANAERKLAEEQFDAKRKIKELEEKLLETRLDAYEALKEAERELGNVIEENYENILEAQRKLHEVEVEISRRLFDAQQALADARREGAESIAEAETALERLNFQFGTADQTLAQILDKLERMKNALLSMPTIELDPPPAGGTIGGFAHGGHYPANKWRIVGERGPELDIPDHSGQIISNDVLRKLTAAMNGGRGGGGGNTITVHEAADPEATAFAVEARMMRDITR